MNDNNNKLQKKVPDAVKEKGQYVLAFSVIATMLLVAGFPMFVIFFFGIFAYFLWKTFSSPSRNETREIFEFYLAANDVLRDDERRWYGFEMTDVIKRGEQIVQRINPAPPLLYFALGALQNKAGDHKAAIGNLAYVAENTALDEASYTVGSPELQNYVRVLRKIEREPADAPLTSAAVRALERARKLRAKTLLEDSRQKFAAPPAPVEEPMELGTTERNVYQFQSPDSFHEHASGSPGTVVEGDRATGSRPRIVKARHDPSDPHVDRKSISEVLHDIYDKNVQ